MKKVPKGKSIVLVLASRATEPIREIDRERERETDRQTDRRA